MKKSWDVTVDGTVHKIEYERKFNTKIIVNGEAYKTKSQNWWINMIDHPIQIGDKNIRVVVIGNKADLAVDGVYVESGEQYTPLNKMPGIANVLIGLSSLGGYLLCGILGMLVGILFSKIYAKKGLEGNKGVMLIAFVGCTVLQIVLTFVIAALQVALGLV